MKIIVFSVLHRTRNKFHLKFLEAIYISMNRSFLCRQLNSHTLDIFGKLLDTGATWFYIYIYIYIENTRTHTHTHIYIHIYIHTHIRMLRAILNKSWQRHPTRHQLYGHLPPITKSIQVRRTRHAGHCWRSRDELIRDVLLWIPTHGRAKAGRPARTYIQQLCEDTGCCPEDLPRAMNDREEWRERVRDIRAASTIWWWWWWYYIYMCVCSYIYIYIYVCVPVCVYVCMCLPKSSTRSMKSTLSGI